MRGATSSQIMESVTKPCMLRTVVNLAAGHGDKIFLKVMSILCIASEESTEGLVKFQIKLTHVKLCATKQNGIVQIVWMYRCEK